MSDHTAGKVAILLHTLAGRLSGNPVQNAEKMLSELTQVQEESLVRILKQMDEASRELPVQVLTPTDRPADTAELPEEGSYVPLTENSARCRGCELGCELKWDQAGHYDGYSCANGEETARRLAMKYRKK